MEVLGEILLQACCEFLAAGGADFFAAFVGWKSHQVKAAARKQGTAPESNPWGSLFVIVLPIAIVLTAILIYVVVARP